MKLYEFEAKQILAENGISVPAGMLIWKNELNFAQIDDLLNIYGLAVKGQILSGARKKSGAVKLVKTKNEAKDAASELLNKEIISLQSGEKMKINAVLVEETVPHEKEIYLSFALDRGSEKTIIIAAEGGMEIESRSEESIFKSEICCFLGLQKHTALNLAGKIGVKKEHIGGFTDVLSALWKIFLKYDGLLLEINPLVIDADGNFIALDAKMIIDDNALFRQPRVSALAERRRNFSLEEQNEEAKAKKIGVSYVKLDGDIGCVVNGAGLAMATMDLLKFYHGRAANFLDVGGGASKEKISRALEILLENKDVSVIFINILGGILRCDILAESVIETLEKIKSGVPIIARLAGTNAAEAKKILEQSGKLEKNIWLFDDLDAAAQIAVKTAKFKFAAKKAEEIFKEHDFFKEKTNGDSDK